MQGTGREDIYKQKRRAHARVTGTGRTRRILFKYAGVGLCGRVEDEEVGRSGGEEEERGEGRK
jgi:hypothetical protein